MRNYDGKASCTEPFVFQTEITGRDKDHVCILLQLGKRRTLKLNWIHSTFFLNPVFVLLKKIMSSSIAEVQLFLT